LLSIDTNILLYSLNLDCPEYPAASDFVQGLASSKDVLLCELVLVELYLLLRNPRVVDQPLSAKQAAATCMAWRTNPNWRVVESAPVMDEVWRIAGRANFPRRRIIDARLARTLVHHGVTELATRNTRDFSGFGFERVFDPLV